MLLSQQQKFQSARGSFFSILRAVRAWCPKHKVVCGCRVQPQAGARHADNSVPCLQLRRRWSERRGSREQRVSSLRRIGIPSEPFLHLAGSCENNSAAFTQLAAHITAAWVSAPIPVGLRGLKWARRPARRAPVCFCRSAPIPKCSSRTCAFKNMLSKMTLPVSMTLNCVFFYRFGLLLYDYFNRDHESFL